MILRKNLKNFIRLARLFFQTVHSVNAKDCTKEQLDVYPYDREFTKRHMIVVAKWKDTEKKGHIFPQMSKISWEFFLIKYNIEKEGHNILKLSIWRHYGNKKRHIPAEVNKPYA